MFYVIQCVFAIRMQSLNLKAELHKRILFFLKVSIAAITIQNLVIPMAGAAYIAPRIVSRLQ